jgi:uncharacterized protein
MFAQFFENLRGTGVPVTVREYLDFLTAMRAGLVTYDIEAFYFLARTAMVKDERHIDRFDRAFAETFRGLEHVTAEQVIDALDLPADWLEKLAEKHLTEEEKAAVEALGGLDKLMETLRKRLEEQKGRHQGGSKWIGTAGTSPFGAYGYNPEGVRIGQDGSRHQRAVKVWDRREFRNLDDQVELGTRNIKVALKRLRHWARDGANEELDLDSTIRATAEHGYLDVKTRPERRNAVKVLLFLDIGGSMDPHVRVVEELFSAARAEFRHLEHFYFHNCLYEGVWRDNRRRWDAQTPTMEILRTYGSDWRCIFVGDASMSPYEITHVGGANEHWNAEAGHVWLDRARAQWPKSLWINPTPERFWGPRTERAARSPGGGPSRPSRAIVRSIAACCASRAPGSSSRRSSAGAIRSGRQSPNRNSGIARVSDTRLTSVALSTRSHPPDQRAGQRVKVVGDHHRHAVRRQFQRDGPRGRQRHIRRAKGRALFAGAERRGIKDRRAGPVPDQRPQPIGLRRTVGTTTRAAGGAPPRAPAPRRSAVPAARPRPGANRAAPGSAAHRPMPCAARKGGALPRWPVGSATTGWPTKSQLMPAACM